MKLFYWAGEKDIKNFGDEINPYLWKKLLKGLLDNDEDTILIGIGTILNENIPNCRMKAIFSSGVGYGNGRFKLDNSYKIYCVRGPLSAKALGIDIKYAITDGALLMRDIYRPTESVNTSKYSYMPHWERHSQEMMDICRNIGINYIDPTEECVESVINKISASEILLTEAMHGAIIADTYRVPWVPIRSSKYILDFKWNDWCMSLGINYSPNDIWPLWTSPTPASAFQKGKQLIKENIIGRQLKKVINKSTPLLSDESRQNTLHCQLEDKLDLLVSDIQAGYYVE